jgi:hypothetical protein
MIRGSGSLFSTARMFGGNLREHRAIRVERESVMLSEGNTISRSDISMSDLLETFGRKSSHLCLVVLTLR